MKDAKLPTVFRDGFQRFTYSFQEPLKTVLTFRSAHGRSSRAHMPANTCLEMPFLTGQLSHTSLRQPMLALFGASSASPVHPAARPAPSPEANIARPSPCPPPESMLTPGPLRLIAVRPSIDSGVGVGTAIPQPCFGGKGPGVVSPIIASGAVSPNIASGEGAGCGDLPTLLRGKGGRVW